MLNLSAFYYLTIELATFLALGQLSVYFLEITTITLHVLYMQSIVIGLAASASLVSLIEMQMFGQQPRTAESYALGVWSMGLRPPNLCFNKLSR